MEDEDKTADVTYINDIKKSSEDKRSYKGLILTNKLKILLINDPETDKSAAALSVAVGYLSDPDDWPGLAHLCEHVLIETNENEFKEFLSKHEGSSNASTGTYQTSYYFQIAAEHFPETLDRFAQFLLCPVVTESAVEKAVIDLDKQYKGKANTDDEERFYQLEKHLSKVGHPYRNFGSGNESTLPKAKVTELKEELLNFYKKWYSTNLMTLTVLGKESLEKLEELVVPLFSKAENKNAERPTWTNPYGPDEVGTKTYVAPIENLKELRLTFPIPDYQAKPLGYISYLVNYKGPGSLFAALNRRHWLNLKECDRKFMTYGLCTNIKKLGKGFGFFEIHMKLTDKGMEKIDELITFVFQYFNMLQERGAQKWISEEIQKVWEINFLFQDKRNQCEFVVPIAENLNNFEYPLEEAITSVYSMEHWRPDLIDGLLSDCLKPSNVKVTVIDQKFEEIADEEEPWYNTKYKLEKISEDVIRNWEESGFNNEMELFTPNDFIPSNFEIFFKGDKNSRPRHPTIIHENDFTRFWLKQDDEFLLPRANLKFEFVSPLTSLSQSNFVSVQIFINLLRDELDEYKHKGELSNLYDFKLNGTKYGFRLSINGFNDKQDVFLDKILQKITDFKIDQQRFDVSREKYVRNLQNNFGDRKNSRLRFLLKEKTWRDEELVDAAEKLEIENFQEFLDKFLSKLFIECLFHGNVDEERSSILIRIVENRFIPHLTEPLLPEELLRHRELHLKPGEYFVEVSADEFEKIPGVQNYYQCYPPTENNVLLEILKEITCMEILQNSVGSASDVFKLDLEEMPLDAVRGLYIKTESNEHPDLIDQRIESLLVKIGESISDMSDEKFEEYKLFLGLRLLEKPKGLKELSAKFWREISSRRYNFNRDEEEVKHLLTIKRDDFIKFFNDYIKENGSERRKLSIRVIPQGMGTCSETDSADSAATRIVDEHDFKTNHEFCPLIEPSVDVAAFKDAGADFSSDRGNLEFLRDHIKKCLNKLGCVADVPSPLCCRPRFGLWHIQPLPPKGCHRRGRIRRMMHMMKRRLIPF